MNFKNHSVYVHGPGAPEYMRMWAGRGFKVTSDIDAASIICFTGGEDVSPVIYGHRNVRDANGRELSYCNRRRDDRDALAYGIALADKKFQVGICRGGQFLNVMNEGTMWQHVNGHTGSHNAMDVMTGEVIKVTSTHHQMMRPHADGTILTVARESSFKLGWEEEWHIEHGDKSELDDVEAIWYDQTRSLCFQPHPEFEGADECREYFFQLVERFLD